MKIHLVKKQTIEDFAFWNSGSKSAFMSWLSSIKYADWNQPADICKTFGSADLLGRGSNRVVFNIGGNNYRMICKYWFSLNKVYLYVKWIGTHAHYDKICDKQEQYTVNIY